MFGAVFAVLCLFGATAGALAGGEGWWGALFGMGAVVLLPVLYGTLGFFAGLLAAWIFNFATAVIGGLEIEVAPE